MRFRTLFAVMTLATAAVVVASFRSGTRNGFCLVTVYESNTHTIAGTDTGLKGGGRREATLSGETLLLESLPAALGFVKLGVLRETYYAGQGSSVFLSSVFGKSRIRIGSDRGASVFDDDLVIRAGPDGKVDLVFLGSRRTLLPDEGASFIGVRNVDGSRLVHEDRQLPQDQIDQLLDTGLPLSRLIVYNHGLFAIDQVKRVSP